eukprot:746648-Hanusia_phi.AAC.3
MAFFTRSSPSIRDSTQQGDWRHGAAWRLNGIHAQMARERCRRADPHHHPVHRQRQAQGPPPWCAIARLIARQAFSLGSGAGESGPCKIKAFINRDDIDFDSVSNLPALQTWELARDNPPDAEHLFKVSKFNRVRILTLLIDSNHGDDTTKITYLAFKGIFTELKTEPVVAAYELRPMPGKRRSVLAASAD